MVASIDGQTTVEGRASGIGSSNDRSIMNTLRSQVDAVMVGANTLRAEKYSIKLPQNLSDQRRSRGEQTAPWLVIPTTSGDLPEYNLLGASPEKTVLIIPNDTDITSHKLSNHILKSPVSERGRTVDLHQALRLLHKEFDIERVLVEGGPNLNHQMMEARLIDEVLLTISPKILGGDSSTTHTLLQGPPLPFPTPAKLLSIHTIGQELFLRYSLTSMDC